MSDAGAAAPRKAIDPIECALAVIGVGAVLSREVEKVKLGQVKEMAGLADAVYAEAKHVVRGEPAKVPQISISYKKTLELLTEKFDVGQLQEMVSAFPPALHEISGDFLIKAQGVVGLLRQLCPVQTKQTLLGPENVMPPALAIRKFTVLLDVLDNPMRVFQHIACGSLLKAQSDIVKQVYPTFSECVTHALRSAGVAERARAKSFVLSPKVKIGYGIWQGIPLVSQSLQNRLQANFKKSQAEKPAPQGGDETSTSVVAKEAMTSTQRGLFPQAPTAQKG